MLGSNHILVTVTFGCLILDLLEWHHLVFPQLKFFCSCYRFLWFCRSYPMLAAWQYKLLGNDSEKKLRCHLCLSSKLGGVQIGRDHVSKHRTWLYRKRVYNLAVVCGIHGSYVDIMYLCIEGGYKTITLCTVLLVVVIRTLHGFV